MRTGLRSSGRWRGVKVRRTAFPVLTFSSLVCADERELSSSLRSAPFHAVVLDSLIDEAAEIFKEYYQIEELGDPTIQAQVRQRLVALHAYLFRY